MERRETLIELLEREFVESKEGPDKEHWTLRDSEKPDRFVWLPGHAVTSPSHAILAGWRALPKPVSG
jgi:hypothetical protein